MMSETPQNDHKNKEPKPGAPPLCTCIQDPFTALPPELRPRQKSTMGNLRKVTCPGCGLIYWTNRKTDLCVNCEKKGIHLDETGKVSGG